MEFLIKYGLDEEDINDLLEENDKNYITSFTDEMIKPVVEVLLKYNIDFISDLIMADIGVFAYTPTYIEEKIKKMISKLGDNYIEILNNDISVFIDYIYNSEV